MDCHILTICLLLVYFVSAAGCHCFDFYVHLCSLLFHLCYTCVHLCSAYVHLCSLVLICVPLVFYFCSLVFICVPLVFHLCSQLVWSFGLDFEKTGGKLCCIGEHIIGIVMASQSDFGNMTCMWIGNWYAP